MESFDSNMQDSPLSPCPFVPWRRSPCPLRQRLKEVYPLAQAAPFPGHPPSGERPKRTNYSHALANHPSLPVSPASSGARTPRLSSPEILERTVMSLEIFL